MCWNDDDAVVIPDENAAGKNRDVAAADGHVDVDGFVQREIGWLCRAGIVSAVHDRNVSGRALFYGLTLGMIGTAEFCQRVAVFLGRHATQGESGATMLRPFGSTGRTS